MLPFVSLHECKRLRLEIHVAACVEEHSEALRNVWNSVGCRANLLNAKKHFRMSWGQKVRLAACVVARCAYSTTVTQPQSLRVFFFPALLCVPYPTLRAFLVVFWCGGADVIYHSSQCHPSLPRSRAELHAASCAQLRRECCGFWPASWATAPCSH